MSRRGANAWSLVMALMVSCASISGCMATLTEVVTLRDAVKLFGDRVVHDDDMAREQTTYTWDETLRGYVDPDREIVVRVARLRGDAYLAQMQPLSAGRGGRFGGPPAAPSYALTLLRVSPPRVHVQAATCHGMRDETPGLARQFGVTYTDGRLAARLVGDRAALIGFFLAGLECGTETLDIKLLPAALTPGGTELAAAAARPGVPNLAPLLSPECDRGDRRACYRLGQVYQRGERVPVDLPRAAALFERVCAAGDVRACVDFALAVDTGAGVARNPARATELLRQACTAGEPYACELLKNRPPGP